MADRPEASDEAAYERMVRQKRKGTRPELRVRHLLEELGQPFELDNTNLPGSPDLAHQEQKWAIFVHGCYWHHHVDCPRATIPKRNRDFWIAKLHANQRRDQRAIEALRDDGFTVLVIWECESENSQESREILEVFFGL